MHVFLVYAPSIWATPQDHVAFLAYLLQQIQSATTNPTMDEELQSQNPTEENSAKQVDLQESQLTKIMQHSGTPQLPAAYNNLCITLDS